MTVHLRASEALYLWRSAMLAMVRNDGPDLTQRQLTILLQIYLEPPPHTVRGLAALLGVTKPVITRALDTMGAMGLVHRTRDKTDRRNVVIQRTVEGSEYIEQLGRIIVRQGEELGV
ncbi:MAG: transcriptional regulator [Rhizobiaceae bacterium MnEN-MB40S]|nr:MAG: transcriptional regulator [Rhizobiaceae bacterium MnEN-MB40S]